MKLWRWLLDPTTRVWPSMVRLLLGVALGLGLARSADAQTWPRDVTGTPAAQCSALDAAGAPQVCSPTNPLPVSSTASSTPLTGGSVNGRNWLYAQPPGFNPFVRVDGGSPGVSTRVLCEFLDDINVICFGVGTGTNNHIWRSQNGGQTYTPIVQTGVIGGSGAFNPNSMVRLASGIFVVASQPGGGGAESFWTTLDGVNWTVSTCTGCGSLGGAATAVTQGSTGRILATAGTGGPTAVLCNDGISSGVSWTCSPTVPGYSTQLSPLGNQLFANPSGAIWLAAGEQFGGVNDLILRSTDDGVSWTTVFSAASRGMTAVKCLTATLCLAVRSDQIHRSTDAGLTWTTVVTSGPDGVNTQWDAIAVFSATTAVVVPWAAAGGTSFPKFYHTADGGLTWIALRTEPAQQCPFNTGTRGINRARTVAVRNGRAVVTHTYTALSGGGPCGWFATNGAGGVAIVGPNGVPWNFGADGSGPVAQGNPLAAFTVAPVQGPTLFNSQTTGAANTAVTVTIAAVAVQRAHLYRIEASCSAGVSEVTITDAGTTVWATLTGEVGTARFRQPFTPAALTGSTAGALVVTLAACGAGNTGTLIVHADRY